jgi:hypothetical protein
VRLITAHRILIIAGIAFFVVYAVIKTQKYLVRGDTFDLVQALLALAIAAGFRVYFRSLARRWGK